MVIITDASGNIQAPTIPDNVYQGSNLANEIVFLAPLPQSNSVVITFRKPNGVLIEELPMTPYTSVPSEYNLSAWRYILEDTITDLYGQVTFQIKVRNGQGTVITSVGGTFPVLRGVPSIPSSEPSESKWQAILDYVASIQADIENGWLEARGLLPYHEDFEYSLGASIFDNQTKTIYTSLTDNNVGNPLSDATKWGKTYVFSRVVWVTAEVTPYSEILEYFNQGKEVLINISNQVLRLSRKFSLNGTECIEFDYFDKDFRAYLLVDENNNWSSNRVPILTSQSVGTQIQSALEPLQFYSAVIKLKVADWVNGSQTKNIPVVNANSMVWVSPAPNGNTGDDFMSAGIYVGGQGSGTLTFAATSTPAVDIDVKIIINNAPSGNFQVADAIYVNQTQENVSQVGDTLNIGGN